MPSICNNYFKLIGTALQLTEFRNRFLYQDEDDEFTLESIVPSPGDAEDDWF